MSYKEQLRKFREPISTLIREHQRGSSRVKMRRDSDIDNPNFATAKPARFSVSGCLSQRVFGAKAFG